VTARCLGVENMVCGWSSFHPADKRKLKEHSCTLVISRVKRKKKRDRRNKQNPNWDKLISQFETDRWRNGSGDYLSRSNLTFSESGHAQ